MNKMASILERVVPLGNLLRSLPFFDIARRGMMQTEQYVAFLRAMAIITETLESGLEMLAEQGRITGWNGSRRRAPIFERDLHHFLNPLVVDLPDVFNQAQKTASLIRLKSLEKPYELLGLLLAVEETLAWAATLAGQIRQAIELKAGMDWATMLPPSAVESIPGGFERDVEDGLREGLESLGRVITSISPERDDVRRILVASINPEAGRHPIPEDPRELEAALAAGKNCWTEFPYYAARYGERGRRFTGSDSAWIATLIGLNQPEIDRQIEWLANFLAVRGMPRVTMEFFLESLGREMVHRVPERSCEIAKLEKSAEPLRQARHRFLSESDGRMLIEEFEEAGLRLWPQAIGNIGRLIVSAVADEGNGVAGAEAALIDWLCEPGRFPQPWADLVRNTARRVREFSRPPSVVR